MYGVQLELRDVSYLKVEKWKCHGYYLPREKKKPGRIVIATKGLRKETIVASILHEMSHCLLMEHRSNVHPGRSYFEQEWHAEALASKLMDEFRVPARMKANIRRESKSYLHMVYQWYQGPRKAMLRRLLDADI